MGPQRFWRLVIDSRITPLGYSNNLCQIANLSFQPIVAVLIDRDVRSYLFNNRLTMIKKSPQASRDTLAVYLKG